MKYIKKLKNLLSKWQKIDKYRKNHIQDRILLSLPLWISNRLTIPQQVLCLLLCPSNPYAIITYYGNVLLKVVICFTMNLFKIAH